MKLSELIKKYREENGLSLRAFAKRSGVTQTTIANIEREQNACRYSNRNGNVAK